MKGLANFFAFGDERERLGPCCCQKTLKQEEALPCVHDTTVSLLLLSCSKSCLTRLCVGWMTFHCVYLALPPDLHDMVQKRVWGRGVGGRSRALRRSNAGDSTAVTLPPPLHRYWNQHFSCVRRMQTKR